MGRKKRPKVEQSEPVSAVPIPIVPPPQQIPTFPPQPPPGSAFSSNANALLSAPIPRDPRRKISDVGVGAGAGAGLGVGAEPKPATPLCLPVTPAPIPAPIPIPVQALMQTENPINDEGGKEKQKEDQDGTDEKDKSSGYAMTSHSADLISEDVYVSDGSDDETDEGNEPLELTLTASKMGLMRRGLRGAGTMYQPKTWSRADIQTGEGDDKDKDPAGGSGATKEVSSDDEEQKEEIQNMDPSQRAAYLLMEKQRKEEEAKILKRKLESSENAGRDPCLFSKRTAFDIRMDQIEEKPWDREAGGTGDVTDYFNYGMGEEDWIEYSERQKIVRQELTDAGRQRRMPDPTIVPVAPKAPERQAPRVAVAVNTKEGEEETVDDAVPVAVGPTKPATKESGGIIAKNEDADDDSDDKSKSTVSTGALEGGAWSVPPGSKLAQLIEDQEKLESAAAVPPPPVPPPPHHMPMSGGPPPPSQRHDRFQHHNNSHGYRDGGNHYQQQNKEYQQSNHYQQQNKEYQQSNHYQQQNKEYQQSNHYQQGGGSHPPPPPPGRDSWRGGRGGGRGFHPGRGGPPGGRGYGGGDRGYHQPPHMQHNGGGRFHGGGRGYHRGGRGGRGDWRRY